ncbi:MAG: prepilin-type N-terminal cleavage/methylation domain-containing protein [Holophagaceae bacterium]|nr:prepilin-type N-terminal cleavage/methylation domain-containing protein [Holophagaceae bacterium]
MFQRGRVRGFSLVEILLVLAIIGVLSGIAIPSYLGQRRRARVIGDAIANIKVVQMALESRKAENGIYGAAGNYNWTLGVADASATTLLPALSTIGSTKMTYKLVIDASGITYTLTAYDPSLSATVPAYQTNQAGAELARMY